VKLVEYKTIYTKRVTVDSKLNIDNVIDLGIQKILKARLAAFDNDKNAAFSNLEENPIWQNEKAGIAIKSVRIIETVKPLPLRNKRDHFGNLILNIENEPIPVDFVKPDNNHHVAIYRDLAGNLQENVVSFYEATTRANQDLPAVNTQYNQSLGWEFLFTMKQNEYFVFPNSKTGFDPKDYDLTDPQNYTVISPNLFRVQKISTKNYLFTHHLETQAISGDDLKSRKEVSGIVYHSIRSTSYLKSIIKVRLDHLGQITEICHD
jgi:CRISPR-associated endonuclease Csn1